MADIRFPTSPLIDEVTGRPSREWIAWLQSPQMQNITLNNALNVGSGGTGLSTYPNNGELLIGNGTGYTLATLSDGAGISISDGSGSITIASTGVLSFSAGTTGLTPSSATNGDVVLSGTLNVANGGTGSTTLTGYVKGAGVTPLTASATIPYTDISGLGTIVTQNLGASGSFTTADAKTVTVVNGIITSIV